MFKVFFNYLISSWRGEQSLAQSFWVNYIGLSGAIYIIQKLSLHLFSSSSSLLLFSVLLEFFIFRLIIFPWQVVGLLRACEKAIHCYELHWIRFAQGFVLVGMGFVFVDVLAVVNTLMKNGSEEVQLSMSAPEYNLIESSDRKVLYFEGLIDYGATRDVRNLLDGIPDVRLVSFSSEGGSIFEARGLSRLISDRKLNTYVSDKCNSSCVIAFMGGSDRRLAADASLGFHQYQLEAENVMPNIDNATELEKDFRYYQSQGVDISLFQQALETPHYSIWYPDHQLLLMSGMIHGVKEDSVRPVQSEPFNQILDQSIPKS